MKIPAPAGINQLLAKFPSASLKRVKGHLKSIDLAVGTILYEARSRIEYAYFPTAGTLSAVVVMPDGDIIEVATVGNEGAVGFPMLSSVATSANRVFCQVPGSVERIETALLAEEMLTSEPLKLLSEKYHAAFLFQVSQSAACNGLHAVQQRCARWLLMTHDRIQGDEIALTHELLAVMLGVRRASVTEVLAILEEQTLIATSRGRITVVDREGLEACSCECYQAVRDEYQRLLP
jgi:CRP-like cAMP-binding protein